MESNIKCSVCVAKFSNIALILLHNGSYEYSSPLVTIYVNFTLHFTFYFTSNTSDYLSVSLVNLMAFGNIKACH